MIELTLINSICIAFAICLPLVVYAMARRVCPTSGHHMTDGLVSLMAVMGSGGHTHEMMTLLSHLKIGSIGRKYSPICFVVSKDDLLSVDKVNQMTQSMNSEYQLQLITRSRSVGQSYWTSIITTIVSLIECLLIVYRVRPKLVVCNGPGVCIPICLSAKLLLRDVRIVFVESFCRTQSLSLSGRILYFCRICDHFLVQWPQLTHRYNRAKYIGLLV